jgi:transposase-like protein
VEEQSTKGSESSRVAWGSLESWARGEIQVWLQRMLEAEVTELLGREKSERREAVDAGAGYRNGYGKSRRLSMTSGTIAETSWVRGLEERRESILPLFKRRTEEVGELLPELICTGWRRVTSTLR